MAAERSTRPHRRLSDRLDLLGVLTTLIGCFGASQVEVLDPHGHWRPVEIDRDVLVYRRWRLDGPLWEFHAAVDALKADDVPELYWRKVQASRARREETRRARHKPRGRP